MSHARLFLLAGRGRPWSGTEIYAMQSSVGKNSVFLLSYLLALGREPQLSGSDAATTSIIMNIRRRFPWGCSGLPPGLPRTSSRFVRGPRSDDGQLAPQRGMNLRQRSRPFKIVRREAIPKSAT